LHSDQGRNFESHLLHEVLQCLGVSKTRTTPLYPQSDGMVERYIKTIDRGAPAESRHIPPEGLGRGITPLSPSLQGINSRHDRPEPS
jgi:transposase InsO family protein